MSTIVFLRNHGISRKIYFTFYREGYMSFYRLYTELPPFCLLYTIRCAVTSGDVNVFSQF